MLGARDQMNRLGDLGRCTYRTGRLFGAPRPAAIVYYVLCAVILGWAAFQRFRLPVWPLADPDIWGYLNPALSKLTGGAFQHTWGRNFTYPGFLFLILASFNSFAAITIVQHILGLLTGGLLLACWHQILRFLEVGAIHRYTNKIAGVLLLAIYLLSSQPIVAEHELRPEAITPFFAVLDIFLTLKFFEQRYLRGKQWHSAWLGAAVVFVSFFLLSLKPSFGLRCWPHSRFSCRCFTERRHGSSGSYSWLLSRSPRFYSSCRSITSRNRIRWRRVFCRKRCFTFMPI